MEIIEEEFRTTGVVKRYRFPTYSSVANTLRFCEKLGLVSMTRTEPSPLRGRKAYRWRKYYVITKPDAWEWENPLLAYYHPRKFKRTRKFPAPIFKLAVAEYEELRRKYMEMVRAGYFEKLRTGWRPPGRS